MYHVYDMLCACVVCYRYCVYIMCPIMCVYGVGGPIEDEFYHWSVLDQSRHTRPLLLRYSNLFDLHPPWKSNGFGFDNCRQMCLSVRMSVCMYMCLYVRLSLYVCVCVCMRCATQVNSYDCLSDLNESACVCMCLCVCMDVRVYVCGCTTSTNSRQYRPCASLTRQDWHQQRALCPCVRLMDCK